MKYADKYEAQLHAQIIEAETRMQVALQHSKDATLHKSDRLKHFSLAMQLERQIQTKYQQLRILDQARFSKEENQSRRAFLAVIRKSKLPTIRQIEGTSEQVEPALICGLPCTPVSTNRVCFPFFCHVKLDETDEQVAEMMDAFKTFAPDDSTLEAKLEEFLQQESAEREPILNAPPTAATTAHAVRAAPPVPKIQLGHRSARVAAAETA